MLQRRILFLAIFLAVYSFGAAVGYGQANGTSQGGSKPLMAEDAFKDVQLLRGIPAKEFMETMGFFAASLSLTCSDCHSEASGANWANYADDTPIKQTTRRMMLMVNAINKANFGGQRSVTCYTCHRGSTRPKIVPSLAAQYAEPPDEDPDEVEILPGARVKIKPEEILDKYIQALGGSAAVSKLASFTAKGIYSGFDSDFGEVPVDVYAKAPNLRATFVHMRAGESVTAYDGREAWSSGPDTLVPIPVIQLLGEDLLGVQLDAQLAFPAQIKRVLTDWRAGFPALSIDGHPVDVIEGQLAGGSRVKLYFDKQTGLLVRQARSAVTAVGTVRTHVIYSDYRPVNGVKLPFHVQVTWVDGQYDMKLNAIQFNAPVDSARFGKPAPLPPAGGRR